MSSLRIKPAKLSDQIVQQLEHMLLEGTLRRDKSYRLSVN